MEEQIFDMPSESEITIGSAVKNPSTQLAQKNMAYASKLRSYRKRCKRKWTDHQIAHACGVNDQMAKSWFFGYNRPDNTQKCILAQMFGCKAEDLEYI